MGLWNRLFSRQSAVSLRDVDPTIARIIIDWPTEVIQRLINGEEVPALFVKRRGAQMVMLIHNWTATSEALDKAREDIRGRFNGQIVVVNQELPPRRPNEAELSWALTTGKLFDDAQLADDAGKLDEAIKKYTEVCSRAPWDPICWMSLGVCYAQKGDHKIALRYLRKALQLDPNNQRVLANLRSLARIART